MERCMYKLIRVVALAGTFSILGLAETWSGTLVDATCAVEKKSASECAPTASSSSFALVLADGKAIKLDANGNAKAADALKNSADRSKNPNEKKPVTASVTGSMSGDTIQVEQIEVR
jgi:hypothetical protein